MGSPSIQVRLVKDPTDAEIKDAVQVWVEAFRDDQFINTLIGGDVSFLDNFMYSTLLAALRGGEVYFASAGDTSVAGVAAWYPPGRALLDSPEQGKGGFDDLLAAFPPELTKWWMEYFLPKYEADVTRMLGEGVKVGAWHLQMLGVKPEVQRRGIGKALVDFVDKKAAENGETLVAEVEKEHNLPFYEKCGMLPTGPPERFESSVVDFNMWVVVKEHRK